MTDDKSIIIPASPDEAWEAAEKTAIRTLCEITDSRLGKTGFVGANPGVLDAWHINTDSTEHGSSLLCPSPGVVHLPYYAEGIFGGRTAMQRWACRVIAGLPVKNRGNIQIFRVAARGLDEPTFESHELAGEAAAAQVWRLRIHLELVFVLR